ncbi:hypothetical protein FA15DRAFT_674373 [Coprinopsis marcescibilis]|uniref:Uncharacterized protein n=1 Tax=Coprinopsis marcescibilis TaxID=230819 RepID=A0A5C3KHV4_COPMA|nr:hypothetical protein FA15DRAFT_674373 [Coprinopsis marcescibilis]
MTPHSANESSTPAPIPASDSAIQAALPGLIELKEVVTAGGKPYRVGFRPLELIADIWTPPVDQTSASPLETTANDVAAVSNKNLPNSSGVVTIKALPYNRGTAAERGYGIAVDWPVTSDWVATTPEVSKVTSITHYRLSYDPKAFIYSYTLEITHKGAHFYQIYDEENDMYEVGGQVSGTRSLWFNSKLPTIKFVTKLRYTMLGRIP